MNSFGKGEFIDAATLLRSKMDDSRRKRVESKAGASTPSPLYIKHDVRSPFLANVNEDRMRDDFREVETSILKDQLATLRNRVKALENQGAEDRASMQVMHQNMLKLSELISNQSGKPIGASQQHPQRQVQNNRRQFAIDLTKPDESKKEEWVPEQTRVLEAALFPASISTPFNELSPVVPGVSTPASPASPPIVEQLPINLAPKTLETAAPATISSHDPKTMKICAPIGVPPPTLLPSQHSIHHRSARSSKLGSNRVDKSANQRRSIARKMDKMASMKEQRADLWLESELRILIEVIDEHKRRSQTYPTYTEVVQAYNSKLRGVIQQAGEETTRGTILEKNRLAPLRTRGGLSNMMMKYGLLSCQQTEKDKVAADPDDPEAEDDRGSSQNGSMADIDTQMEG
ncbi:uncharacterized protein RAG0_01201 [Rhynchosporium agropyri]|uniref:Uncharacterized protein n=1 Tax=Rhynchosporium agropyri TaxID=914238 RepID=A0A1E1JVZ7_9HELO|nr:uncharacterized protein RAG0_01201 [Rhynchosporium agropyri]